MDKKIIKQIIAKEGLIFLGILLFGAIIINTTYLLRPSLEDIFNGININNLSYGRIIDVGYLIVIFGYPLYLLIRFIFWAVKTLEKEININTKKMLARESLIILGIIVIGCIIISTAGLYNNPRPIRIEQQTDTKKPIDLLTEKRISYPDTGENNIYLLSEVSKAAERQTRVENIGLFFLLLSYPIYLLIRFIAWAIKTLRK
jgi:uncharacterized integral membrane protein